MRGLLVVDDFIGLVYFGFVVYFGFDLFNWWLLVICYCLLLLDGLVFCFVCRLLCLLVVVVLLIWLFYL